MTKGSTRWPQRTISETDLEFAGYVRAPFEAKVTAHELWFRTDLDGRRPLDVQAIADELYPWDNPQEATDRVELHILMLEESGFLITYEAQGCEWIQLRRPLRGDRRGRASTSPPPPPTRPETAPPEPSAPRSPRSMESPAMERERAWARERARERARDQARAEEENDAASWEAWRRSQSTSMPRRPERPLLLKAPPIGCSDHPNGQQQSCGPCGTARRQHDLWLSRERYEEQLAIFEEGQEVVDDDEPF
jgi:hypothetical protein